MGGAGQEGPRHRSPRTPVEVRLATDDFTPEVLCDLLQVSSKVLLRSDELATVLGAYERYQKPGAINAGRAHMLALYDGGPRRIDRVIRGKMFVKNWSAVPVGHIQPAKVRQLVSGLSDDGLLQRFMIVMPPRVEQGDPDDDDITTDWSAIDQFAQIVETLFAHAAARDARPGRKARVLQGRGRARRARDPAAAVPTGRAHRGRSDPPGAAEGGDVSKWRGLLARLSLVFHCVELAEAKHAGKRPTRSPCARSRQRPSRRRAASSCGWWCRAPSGSTPRSAARA